MAPTKDQQPLHFLFFPFMAPGHTVLMIAMAKLFAARGVKATIIITPGNGPLIQTSIANSNIHVHLISFPSDVDVPKPCKNLLSMNEDNEMNILIPSKSLSEPFRIILKDLVPDCIVTDMFLPWTADTAAELGIPRLMFNGNNFFCHCALHSIEQHNLLSIEEESFVFPGLPHRIEMRKSMMPNYQNLGPHIWETLHHMKQVESKTHGMVVNSFYELEPDYADYYRNVMGQRAYTLGPLTHSVIAPGMPNSFCLKWLDDRSQDSVVYVCFGSISDITAAQVREIAAGLEASERPFVWTVKKDTEEWLPEGFEERVDGKGLVIKGWAPQIPILNHGSVGGFVTHCGWNLCLEGVSAGLPFVTWPLFSEQFYNERLIVDVLKIGVSIGMVEYAETPEVRKVVEAARIERAIEELMGYGEEEEERRQRAKEFGRLAKKALEKGGSSYNDVGGFIAEISGMRPTV